MSTLSDVRGRPLEGPTFYHLFLPLEESWSLQPTVDNLHLFSISRDEDGGEVAEVLGREVRRVAAILVDDRGEVVPFEMSC